MNISGIPVNQEQVAAPELDRFCAFLKDNITLIESQINQTWQILCVPKAAAAGVPPSLEPQTLSEFLTFLNGKMEYIMDVLNQLNTSLRAKVGELKILD